MSCPKCGQDVLDIDVKCGACGAILGASGAHRMLGTIMLGQYELVDVLGQGGMSVVFRGRHNLTQQEVALKILPPELAAHSQVKSRFLDEAKTLAALDHPNIVHLYNFGQDDGHFVLAMQLVQGRTWERMILEAGRLDWTVSCRIAIDVLRALEYAHDRGVIHRDMKPSNVLVRARDGVATVMDFGIAKMTTSSRLTATGQTMGTVRYMSPEQVRGQDIDLRTDLYSLGATLYESMTGETPFDGSTHFEIMTKHLSEAPRRPSKCGATMPAAVEDAVLRCLAKRADDRFGSARDMRKVLEAALHDAGIGLVETQKLAREMLGDAPPATALETSPERLGARDPRDPRGAATTGLADVLEPGDSIAARRPRRVAPWLALAPALVAVAGAVFAWHRDGRYRPTVEIAGVTLTKGAAFDRRSQIAGGGDPDGSAGGAGGRAPRGIDKLVVETDGAIEPAELAELYASTLRALRVHAGAGTTAALEIADPVDVLLAVPARALCEPTAYLDRQAPENCASALSATAIGAKGTRRLMVVSDRAQLHAALRKGVAQAACDFSPVDDNQVVRQICDVTTRFAESTN